MFEVTWITDHLATGQAPMSYAELDSIREQGISAIVNLCGEFCDLHEIEEKSGFEVYYLPVPDECAPDLAAMEQALEWLDEAIYLNKKVLVHCRHGHGRTGTFVSAYMLRRGLSLKQTEKQLKGKKANPTNYSQWRLLKHYNKQEKTLAAVTPSIDNRRFSDLPPLTKEYEKFVNQLDAKHGGDAEQQCGLQHCRCCGEPFDLRLVESIYLSYVVNRQLKQSERAQTIERANVLITRLRSLHRMYPGIGNHELAELTAPGVLQCPLLVDEKCSVFELRPLRCRYWQFDLSPQILEQIDEKMLELSKSVYLILTGAFPPEGDLLFSSADTISGKFVQLYFQAMTRGEGAES